MKKLTRVVLRADTRTVGGHIYPEAVLREAVEKAQERVKGRRFFGNSNGADPLVLDAVSHVVTDLRMENGAMVAEVEFLDTPLGLQAQKLLDTVGQNLPGVRVRLTPTGRGTTTQAGVVESYKLESVTAEFEPFGRVEGLDRLAELAAAKGGLVEVEAAVKLVDAIIERTLADHPAGGERMIAELMTKGMKICRDALAKRIAAVKEEIRELEREESAHE